MVISHTSLHFDNLEQILTGSRPHACRQQYQSAEAEDDEADAIAIAEFEANGFDADKIAEQAAAEKNAEVEEPTPDADPIIRRAVEVKQVGYTAAHRVGPEDPEVSWVDSPFCLDAGVATTCGRRCNMEDRSVERLDP